MKNETFRFVTWDNLDAYLQLGWLPAEIPDPHTRYGWGVVWRCDCKCVEPFGVTLRQAMRAA